MRLIEHLLRARIGMEPASIGLRHIQRAVRQGMGSLGVANEDEYSSLLNRGGKEWSEFIELIVVPETWFFRDRHPFISLTNLVRETWLPAHPRGILKILSLPCSTGEEPYSAAMALLDAQIDPARFQIDAVDISASALDAAQKGKYRKHSFRGGNLPAQRKYFTFDDDCFAVQDRVRQTVSFRQANILDDSLISGMTRYDVIFCRNLLIYCDELSRKRILARLAMMLAPGGYLFAGAAEGGLLQTHGFVSANLPMSFAFQPSPMKESSTLPQPAHRLSIPLARSFAVTRDPLSAPASESGQSPDEIDLKKAQDLANAGSLEEAMKICQRHVQVKGASAQAFYLLGLLIDARGEKGGADYYRKTLYLDPGHYLALLQMSSLALKAGDEKQARAFRVRAERVRRASASV